MNIEIVSVSDIGKIRPHNEDSTISDARLGIALVADGMGGYKAGEVASAIAATSILNDVKSGLKQLGVIAKQTNKENGYNSQSQLLIKAITHANSMIYNKAQEEELCRGMGTTIVIGLFYDGMISVANVGDSRLYLLRENNFKQITKDHSLLQEVIDKGKVPREKAEAMTPRNLVTRALGIEARVKVDIFEEQVKNDDIYLLCSDGLNDMVTDEEIHLTLSKYSVNLQQAANELVAMANSRGGRDNISIILAQIKSTNNNVKSFNIFKRKNDVLGIK